MLGTDSRPVSMVIHSAAWTIDSFGDCSNDLDYVDGVIDGHSDDTDDAVGSILCLIVGY